MKRVDGVANLSFIVFFCIVQQILLDLKNLLAHVASPVLYEVIY